MKESNQTRYKNLAVFESDILMEKKMKIRKKVWGKKWANYEVK